MFSTSATSFTLCNNIKKMNKIHVCV